MEIEYPILNISLQNWNNDIVEELFRENDIYYSNNEIFFKTYLLGHKYVDCKGDIYKLLNKYPIKNLWLRLRFIKRSKFQFEKTNERISFEELQILLIDRVNQLSGEDAKNEWIEKIKNSPSIASLIKGI